MCAVEMIDSIFALNSVSISLQGDNLLHELLQLRNDNFKKILDLFISMKPTLITGVNNDGTLRSLLLNSTSCILFYFE
jgi:hypothetical protein